jgi:hypothetical protein
MHTLVALLLLLAQLPSLPNVPSSPGSGQAVIVSPRITFTSPSAESVVDTSVLAQTLGGAITAGSGAITGAVIVCTGATAVSSTSVAGAAATTWTRAQTFVAGTTVCSVTVTDANGRTAIASKTFIVTNPDLSDPVVSAGADASTGDPSYVRDVTCTDDVGCVSVTWSGAGGASGTCSLSGSGTVVSATCNFSLASGANTITVTGTDQAAKTGTDQVVITRTSDGGAPTVSAGADASTSSSSFPRSVTCTDDVACTSVSWSGPGGTDDCEIVSTNGLTRSANCEFALLTTGTCGATRVNTITVTGQDAVGNSATDTVDITRTATLTVTSVSGGSFPYNQAGTTLTLSATGGANCSYTWTNNGAGTSLNDGDADCAGLTISSAGVISGTATTAAAKPATCSWTAKVSDGINNDTQALTTTIYDPTATTYFQTISALTEAQAIEGCSTTGDAKGCSLSTLAQDAALLSSSDTSSYTIDTTKGSTPVTRITWAQTNASGPVSGPIKMPIRATGTDDYLIIWDTYYDQTWTRATCGGVIPDALQSYTHKEFQVAFGPVSGPGRIYTEVRSQFPNHPSPYVSCDDIAVSDMRSYSNGPQTDLQLALISSSLFHALDTAGLDTAGAGTQIVDQYPIKHGKWTRHWLRIKLSQPETAFTSWNTKYGITVPAGLYHQVSLWIADEDRDPVAIVYEAPWRIQLGSETHNVTAYTCANQIATVTFDAAHKLAIGDAIHIVGAGESAFNGNFVSATLPSTTQVTFNIGQACPAGSASGSAIKGGSAMAWLNAFWYEHNTSSGHPNATGQVTFTGTDGTLIPKALFMTRSDGTKFKTQGPCEDATNCIHVVGGTATMNVIADAGGPNGTTAAGTVLTITSPPAGLNPTATVTAAGLTGGRYLLDGDAYFYERWFSLLKNYALPATPLNDTAIFQKPVR